MASLLRAMVDDRGANVSGAAVTILLRILSAFGSEVRCSVCVCVCVVPRCEHHLGVVHYYDGMAVVCIVRRVQRRRSGVRWKRWHARRWLTR